MPGPKDKPDKVKSEELDDQIIDDTKDIPDMGAGEELSEEPSGEETSEVSDIEVAKEGIPDDVKALMKKKGYKTLDELGKAMEASEKKLTKLEQEQRLTSLLPVNVPARPRTQREPIEYPEPDKDPMDMSKEEYQDFRKKEREAVKQEMRNEYLDAEEEKEYRKVYTQAVKKIDKDPDKFVRLKPIMNDLRLQHPNANFDQLYEAADKLEDDYARRRKEQISEEIGMDVDELKTVLGKVRPAVISGASGAGAESASGLSLEEKEKKVKDAIFGKQSALVRE